MHLKQDKPEWDQRFLIANLEQEEAEYKARRTSMTWKDRQKALADMMGWSLEMPYSRELYHAPQDFRNLSERQKGAKSFHLGVAILDTRDLRDVIQNGFKLDNPSDLIRTYQFAVQDRVPKVDRFCFGDTEAISREDLKRRFVEWQKGRDVIGVAYTLHNDLALLKEFEIILTAICWIDLALAQYIPLQNATAPSLAVVMNRLRIRYAGKLHEPGNDAHFAMRTLLGLAVLDFWREWTHWGDGLGAIPSWYDLATKIVRAEVPCPGRHGFTD
ncbi:uncharacterized protein FFUJ_07833 [Fusarium fujikuroi IMI 58289]|uniref:Gfd2/YDR514C-like C-terminal domain-containing protein n=1 Tax=Gibberella fujikuroi (strain CBS 195.34 / IMI 58289 / NRRL A-6831) TaxID=1279085 RepID=S0E3K7_GIBF5|nr:uncharacterized protein FFUJ_07833 [Fusarium fujikuroi IMI 58289]KLP17512.1 uncharacterized protein LW94_2855 [Fusarium fujikuroi]CCT69270.1 uncharacterized protein FFUJ_07833 [Fusarium fujikuroi IMI 58289]SCO07251.1 uncharacterized protein FFM5_09032 [Fusarium fujikuroi]